MLDNHEAIPGVPVHDIHPGSREERRDADLKVTVGAGLECSQLIKCYLYTFLQAIRS